MQHLELNDVKKALRNGPFTELGGYPLYFITTDGAALSFKAVREEWRQVVYSHLHKLNDGWGIAAIDINYEDTDLVCAHTNYRIESAYGDDAELCDRCLEKLEPGRFGRCEECDE